MRILMKKDHPTQSYGRLSAGRVYDIRKEIAERYIAEGLAVPVRKEEEE